MSSLYEANCDLIFDTNIISACIKGINQRVQISHSNNQNAFQIPFIGNLVNPKRVPPYLTLKSKPRIIIYELNLDGTKKETMRGIFVVNNLHQTRWRELAEELGDRIEGTFFSEEPTDTDLWSKYQRDLSNI